MSVKSRAVTIESSKEEIFEAYEQLKKNITFTGKSSNAEGERQDDLSRKQKESIFLLQIGTFLEYFDLMLFVHMAVILNDVFFPKVDPFTGSLLTAFSFCSTFVLKPVGALIFGYIGDKKGRKSTVIITTSLMAFSCIVMANVPTYAQVGILASWVITICRGLQGMSSIGESVGAELYTAEMIKPPLQYSAVGFIGFAGVVGMVTSLLVARTVLAFGINWRIIFWIGAAIALIGSVARVTLREAPEFGDAKRRLLKMMEKANRSKNTLKGSPVWNEKASMATSLAYFLVFCGWPFCFYFSYVYCGSILKNEFGYTKEILIHHNLILSLFNLTGLFAFIWLTKKFHPIAILKAKLAIYLPFICTVPWLLSNAHSVSTIFMIQVFGVALGNSTIPAKAIFLTHFPIFKRFRYASMITAISHIAVYVATSFGLVYAVQFFGKYGILLISLPTTISFLCGILYFEKLEKRSGRYRSLSQSIRENFPARGVRSVVC